LQELFFNYIQHWSYVGLFLVLFVAGLGVPLPEDIPLIAGGWLCHHHPQTNVYLMTLVGLIGVLVGDGLLFNMGRRFGTQLVGHRWLQRIAKPWLVAKAQEKFDLHGAKIIFLARFMPGLRSVIFLIAGTLRVPYWKFLIFDGSAALISVPVWVFGGWYFGGRIEEFISHAKVGGLTVGAVVLSVFVGYILFEVRKIKKKNAPLVAEGVKVMSLTEPLPDAMTEAMRDAAKMDRRHIDSPAAKAPVHPEKVTVHKEPV